MTHSTKIRWTVIKGILKKRGLDNSYCCINKRKGFHFLSWRWILSFFFAIKRSVRSLVQNFCHCFTCDHRPTKLPRVICTGVTPFAPVLHFLHWCYTLFTGVQRCYTFCTGVTLFVLVLHFLHLCYTFCPGVTLCSLVFTGATLFAPVLHFLHWCYNFCTGVTLFAPLLHFLYRC